MSKLTKLPVESFLELMVKFANDTGNTWIIKNTKEFEKDICSEFNLCPECYSEIRKGIAEGSHYYTECDCGLKNASGWW